MISTMQQMVPVKNIKLNAKWVYRKELGDVAGLAQSMAGPNGQLQDILIDTRSYLILGRRRLEAARINKWTDIRCTICDLSHPLEAIKHENEFREEFRVSEKIALAQAIERDERSKASARQRNGKAANGTGRAEEKAAKAVGLSRSAYARGKAILNAAAADPELEPLVEEMDNTKGTGRPFNRLKKRSRNGKPTFGWGAYDKRLGSVVRGPDELVAAFPHEAEVEEYRTCMFHLAEFAKSWSAWRERLTKEKSQ